MFREAKPKKISTVSGQKSILFPEYTVNKYFIMCQKSKKWQSKANYIRKYIKYSISKLGRVFTDDACDFFRYSPVNNALSPSRADARKTL